jgi:two-component system, NarL family, sensor kinase
MTSKPALTTARPRSLWHLLHHELVGFYLATAAALLAVALGAVVTSRMVARDEALHDRERGTHRLADLSLRPLLANWLQSGTQESLDQLNGAVWNRMSDGYLTEVTVWSENGRIIYSDDNTAIGTIVEPPDEVISAINRGTTHSDFEDTPELEAGGTQADGEGFVEVYVPIDIPGQPRYAFEAYFAYSRVNDVARGLLTPLLPVVLVPLVLLQLIQLPLATAIARRARRNEKDRNALLERALSVWDRERQHFAAVLHDGAIQDLAGVGYALEALTPSLPEKQRALIAATQETLKRSIESLRTLMTDLYPPDLTTAGLQQTVLSLARRLEANGIAVQVSVGPLPELPEDSLRALYRVTRETFANIAKHAQATRVTVTLGRALLDNQKIDGEAVELLVADNGVGVDQERLDRRREGHLGLRLLRDRLVSLGGELTLISEPGEGTRVRATVPTVSSVSESG